MRIFVTGATGYIGGSVAVRMIADGHEVAGLVRDASRVDAVRALGIRPVAGSLDDSDVLARAAQDADVVVNAASADHPGAVEAILGALTGSGKAFVHTSGSSIVGSRSGGHAAETVFDEETPFEPSPTRAARVALDRRVRAAAADGIRTVVIAPSLIYGPGRGLAPDSIQVPWLLATARRHGVPRHLGPGENLWSNVHLDDLVELYALAIGRAPAGAFYWAENGEASMREICRALGRALGMGDRSEAMTAEQAAAEWGEGPSQDTMGSNSRVRARRAREELGWRPAGPSLMEEIERGCYAPARRGQAR